MDRRRFLLTSLVYALAEPRPAEAQRPAKIYRLGMLSSRAPDAPSAESVMNSVPIAMRALGYEEGRNLVVERRYAHDQLARLPELARQLVRQPVDVIVGNGTSAVRAAMEVTRSTPIVVAFTDDPVARGLVRSMARPGGNVTGIALGDRGEMIGKRLQLLKEIRPTATRIARLVAPDDPPMLLGKTVGFQVVNVLVVDDDYELAFAKMLTAAVDGYEASGPSLFGDRDRLVRLAAKHRLPAVYEWRQAVEDGGLLAYSADFRALYRRVATYVDRLLQGAKPADIPIEQPTKFELVINLKTAKALGLTIPPSLLLRADNVIE